MLSYQKDLLTLCACALFGKVADVGEIDKGVIDEAGNQTVLSLIAALLGENCPEKQKALSIAAKNMLVKNEHIVLHKLMSSARISYVVLKGCAAAAYYPEPILRTMGDVDFLVRPEDVPRACSVLEANGFKTEDEGKGLHYAFTKGNSVWELHLGINGIPKSEQGEIIKGYFADIFEKSALNSDGFIVPSDFHHGLIILLHMLCHLIADGFGLRHLCDWAVFVSRFSDKEFTDMFEAPLKKVGLWKAAKLMTACSVKYLGCPEKAFAEDVDDDLIDALIGDIFTGGNFGYKQEGRGQQIKFISNRNDYTVNDKSIFSQFFVTLNRKAKSKYGVIKKYPVFLPIGWAAVAVDYIGLLLKGERTTKNWKSNIETAKLRKSIYNKIELFEIDN